MEGVHDVCLHQGNMNSDSFSNFVDKCLLPILLPVNWHNHRSVVILDNASIHHLQEVKRLMVAELHKLYQNNLETLGMDMMLTNFVSTLNFWNIF